MLAQYKVVVAPRKKAPPWTGSVTVMAHNPSHARRLAEKRVRQERKVPKPVALRVLTHA